LKSKIMAITIALAVVMSLVLLLLALLQPLQVGMFQVIGYSISYDGSNVDNNYNVTFAQTGTAITGTGEYPISGPPYSYTWNITGAVISGINSPQLIHPVRPGLSCK